MRMFEPFNIKDLALKNRIVMPPMCMYSSDATGQVLDFHRIHYGTRAVGGAGLIIQEATAVSPEGRLSNEDLGIWNDGQIDGLASLVRLVHAGGAKAGIQLAHAGRKAESDNPESYAPSAFPFSDHYRVPEELTAEGIRRLTDAFSQAARRAAAAGYDALEIHGAHGYLIHEFLSPLSNRRTDGYGGSLDNRARFLREVVAAIRREWPANRALLLRLSATDYLAGGLTIEDTQAIVNLVKADVDLFHLSSGGLLTASFRTFPGYQVRLAESVRRECQVPTIAVGLITSQEQVEEILGNSRADLVALGRELLRNPYWPIRHSVLGQEAGCPIPEQYERAWK